MSDIIFDSAHISSKGVIISFHSLSSAQVARRDFPLTEAWREIANLASEQLHKELNIKPQEWAKIEPTILKKTNYKEPSILTLEELGL